MKKVLSLILVVAMIAAMGIVTASAAGTHTARDICYLSSSTAKSMTLSGTETDDFGDITSQVTGDDAGLVFFGWHASSDEITAFGYSINDGDVSWTGTVGPTTTDVVNAGMGVPGTADVERFSVVVPFTEGDNVVEIYCQTASEEYIIWTATYTCSLDFSTMKEINFDDQAESDYTDTTSSPLMSDTNFASFISANYKIADGALVLKRYADIRWWGLSLVPTADYVAAEYEFSAEKLVALTYFSVNDANDATQETSNQGDGGKLILVGPSDTEGKLNVYDNAYTPVATIDAGETYTLTAILEVGSQNYYIAINGERLDVTCQYPVEFTAVGGMRVDLQANPDAADESVVTYDNIVVKNCELSDYPVVGTETPVDPETPETETPADPETPETETPADPETPETETPADPETPSDPETEAPETETPSEPSVDTADNTAIVFMIAAAAFVVTVLLKKRAY